MIFFFEIAPASTHYYKHFVGYQKNQYLKLTYDLQILWHNSLKKTVYILA